jgi:hypothetical protein
MKIYYYIEDYLPEFDWEDKITSKFIIKDKSMEIKVVVPPAQLFHALGLIQSIKNKNKMKFNLTVKLDYLTSSSGMYIPSEPNSIYLNPNECKKYESEGYVEDNTLFGTAIHEFCHFLTFHYFKNFKEKYPKEFPEERIILTSYKRAQSDYDEEIAEIMSLHLRNPYFLKLLFPNHHKFMQSYIKPTVPCNDKIFIKIYNQMNQNTKELVFTKWGIIIEHDIAKVIKV